MSFARSLFRSCFLPCCLILGMFVPPSSAQDEKPKRARLPDWKTFPSDIFFKDAFKEGLVGERPATLGGTKAKPSDKNETSDQDAQSSETTGVIWSNYVSAQTLEDEVKSLQIDLQKSVTTPGKFSGGGYRDVRRQFTELATLFAVIGNFDRQVRWKESAPLARDLFARAAANAKVTSKQAFNDAKQRKIDLEELVRGGSIVSKRPAEKKNDWSKICDRGPLMQRFTGCFDEGLLVWTANENDFKKNAANIRREAELLKMFAHVLTREGMEDAGDDDYDTYSRQLGKAAEDVLQALRNDDAQAARKATSSVGKSCTDCHEDYRG